MPKSGKRKETPNEPEPSAMPNNAISKAQKILAKGWRARMSRYWYCYEGLLSLAAERLLGHPVLWSQCGTKRSHCCYHHVDNRSQSWTRSYLASDNERCSFGRQHRFFPTDTEFLRQLPNFTYSYRILPRGTHFFGQKMSIFSDIFLRYYLQTTAFCFGTSPGWSPPLSQTSRSRPPTPPPHPTRPGRPCRAPPPAAGHEASEFHRYNYRIFADSYRIWETAGTHPARAAGLQPDQPAGIVGKRWRSLRLPVL